VIIGMGLLNNCLSVGVFRYIFLVNHQCFNVFFLTSEGAFCPGPLVGPEVKSSQVNTLPKAKRKTRSKQNKDMHKCSSVYSERGVPLPVLTSGGE